MTFGRTPAGRVAARPGNHLPQSSDRRRDAASRARGPARHAGRDRATTKPLPPARTHVRSRSARGVPERPRMRAAADAWLHSSGQSGDDLVFVDNTTTGANGVLRSFALRAGRRGAGERSRVRRCHAGRTFAARERGATVRTVTIPTPYRSESGLQTRSNGAVGPRHAARRRRSHGRRSGDRLAGWRTLHRGCKRHGVSVLVDGAHVPGCPGARRAVARGRLVRRQPAQVGLCTAQQRVPLGRPRRARQGLHPAVISWGLDQGITTEFDLPGTRDPSPFLAAPAALSFIDDFGGLSTIHAYTHDLAVARCAHACRAPGHARSTRQGQWSVRWRP